MSDWGFDFVRFPISYPYYLSFDRTQKITPEEVYNVNEEAVDKIDRLVQLAHKYNLHVCLNLHRAPGYCINAGFNEPYNLWKDEEAQKAFYFHWNMWAKRYKNVSSKKISFDLLNEPCMRDNMNDQHSTNHPIPGELYRKVAKEAAESIRKENKHHLVIADGNNVGNQPIPEIADQDIAQSCRGYFPHLISHYKAPWANKACIVSALHRNGLRPNLQPWILHQVRGPWLVPPSKSRLTIGRVVFAPSETCRPARGAFALRRREPCRAGAAQPWRGSHESGPASPRVRGGTTAACRGCDAARGSRDVERCVDRPSSGKRGG
jgi:hypothetical protein